MMKKTLTLALIFAFVFCTSGFVTPASAQTEKIPSVERAKELAANAGGTYVDGAATPSLASGEVALPVIDEATGSVVGHIVAEQGSLIDALTAGGYESVAGALTAQAAGAEAGLAVAAGLTTGTIVTAAAVTAGVIGLVIAATSDSDDGTTTRHTTTSHHSN